MGGCACHRGEVALPQNSARRLCFCVGGPTPERCFELFGQALPAIAARAPLPQVWRDAVLLCRRPDLGAMLLSFLGRLCPPSRRGRPSYKIRRGACAFVWEARPRGDALSSLGRLCLPSRRGRPSHRNSARRLCFVWEARPRGDAFDSGQALPAIAARSPLPQDSARRLCFCVGGPTPGRCFFRLGSGGH
jgi:hypothetical protein